MIGASPSLFLINILSRNSFDLQEIRSGQELQFLYELLFSVVHLYLVENLMVKYDLLTYFTYFHFSKSELCYRFISKSDLSSAL